MTETSFVVGEDSIIHEVTINTDTGVVKLDGSEYSNEEFKKLGYKPLVNSSNSNASQLQIKVSDKNGVSYTGTFNPQTKKYSFGGKEMSTSDFSEEGYKAIVFGNSEIQNTSNGGSKNATEQGASSSIDGGKAGEVLNEKTLEAARKRAGITDAGSAAVANGTTTATMDEATYTSAQKVEIDKLRYKDAGDTYEIYYKDKDGNTVAGNLEWTEDGKYKILDYKTGEEVSGVDESSIRVKDQNAYRTVADQYATISSTPQTTSKLHDIGVRNREDIHDTAIESFQRPLDGATINAGDGIMWHTHITQPSGSDDRDGYMPGKSIDLSTNPQFRSLVKNNIGNNILGDYLLKKDGEQYSKAEFIAAYASSGQYSVTDLKLTVDALEQNNIRSFKGKTYGSSSSKGTSTYVPPTSAYYNNKELKDIYADLKDTDWEKKAVEYDEELKSLQGEFQKFHDQLNAWSGEASKADQATLQCINGKFEVTLGNIEKGLKVACEKSKELSIRLETLQKAEDAVFSLSGEAPADADGFSGTFEARSVKVIKEELEKKEKELRNKEDNEPKNPETRTIKGTGSQPDRTEEYESEAHKDWVTAVAKLKEEISNLKQELALAEEELEKREKAREEALIDVLETYYFLKNLDKTKSSFKDYFTAGNKYYDMIHGKDGNFDLSTVLSSHDDIMEDFQDYKRMPVITALSEYEPGAVIAFDDAHGYVYAVTGAFDPLTGTIKIACFDKTGKQVGTEVTIWDQREIVPIKYVRKYDKFYEDYPDTFVPTTGQEVETIPDTGKPKPRPTPTPGTTTPGTTTPPATTAPPGTTAPPATTAPGTTAPPVTTAPGTTTPPEVETIPPIPVFTVPWSTIIYTVPGGGPGGPDSPHTGLDAIYGTGDTKQSATGLGALAGLAAGAAGLGLTGLIGDKDDEDEEEEDEDLQEVSEEPKEEEKKETEEDKEVSESTPSNPQFF